MLGYIYKLFDRPPRLDTKRVESCVAKYWRGRGHWAIIHNVYIHSRYEMDTLSIKSRNIIETETKVSRGDFLKDLKKGKHRLIRRGVYPANYLYYACPDGLIKPEELPYKAGLLWVSDKGTVRMKREAKRIHRKPLRDRLMVKIARKMDKKLRAA